MSSIDFTDKDLDFDELGGTVTWAEPVPEVGLVTHYSVHLAWSADGASRSQIGPEFAVDGDKFVDLLPDKARADYDEFVIYTRSSPME